MIKLNPGDNVLVTMPVDTYQRDCDRLYDVLVENFPDVSFTVIACSNVIVMEKRTSDGMTSLRDDLITGVPDRADTSGFCQACLRPTHHARDCIASINSRASCSCPC